MLLASLSTSPVIYTGLSFFIEELPIYYLIKAVIPSMDYLF